MHLYGVRNITYLVDTIVKSFSFEEIITEDFIEFITKNFSAVSANRFSYLITNRATFKEKVYCNDEIVNITKNIVEVLNRKSYSFLSANEKVDLLKELGQNLSSDDTFKRIDKFSKLLLEDSELTEWLSYCSSDTSTKYLDSFLSSMTDNNALDVFDKIRSDFPNYANFPLIILNEKINKAERVKILKKVYKQKNLPQFINALTKNIKSLDALDVFIEATILNNNRVTEKDENIRKIFKYVFLDPYYSITEKRDIQGKEEFSKKYVKYIKDRNFVRIFYNTYIRTRNNQYSHERLFRKMVDILISSCSFEEKLEILTSVPELRERVNDYICMEYPKDSRTIQNESFRKSIITVLKLQRLTGINSLIQLFNNFNDESKMLLEDDEIRDIIIEILKTEELFKWVENADSSYYSKILREPSTAVGRIVSCMTIKDFSNIKILSGSSIFDMCFLLDINAISCSSLWSFSERYETFISFIGTLYNKICNEEIDKEIADNIIEAYSLYRFMDKDSIAKLLDDLLDCESGKLKSVFSTSSKVLKLQDIYNILKNFENIALKCYEVAHPDSLDDIRESIDNLNESLSVLSAVSGNSSF